MSLSFNARLTDQARTFEVLAWIAVVTLSVQFLVLLGMLSLIGPASYALAHGDWRGFFDVIQPVLLRLIDVLPALIYLGGVLAAARIFGRVAKGELFSRANSEGLAEVGSALLWGAAASAFILPWIKAAVAGEHGFAGIHLETETWVIAVIGGAILVLGKMMAQAGRLQSQLDEII